MQKTVVACIALSVTWIGCGDDSPVTPDRQPQTFRGELASDGFVSHPLLLERGGTIRMELVDLTPIFIDVTFLGPDLELEDVLAVGLGIGEFDDEGQCILELRPTITQGRVLTVLVSDTINCLAVFDSGALPDDSLVAYTVVVTDAAGD